MARDSVADTKGVSQYISRALSDLAVGSPAGANLPREREDWIVFGYWCSLGRFSSDSRMITIFHAHSHDRSSFFTLISEAVPRYVRVA